MTYQIVCVYPFGKYVRGQIITDQGLIAALMPARAPYFVQVAINDETPEIGLSGASVAASASVGTVIGVLSVENGDGNYTYSLTSNPGSLFSISGANLEVAAALSAGSTQITVQATNGGDSTVSQPFTITVTSVEDFALQSAPGVDMLAATGSPILVQ